MRCSGPTRAASVHDVIDETAETPDLDAGEQTAAVEIDLDAIERDLDDVHTALGRLDDGSYWTDEVTGEPIPDQVLADLPTARRAT